MKTHVVVKKFGGTSVGSTERIQYVARRIIKDMAKGEQPVIVASAMSGETNRLVQLAQKVDPYCRGDAYDMLLASGEQISIALLAMALQQEGVKSIPLLAHQLGIHTDSTHSKARIQHIDKAYLLKWVGRGYVPIIAGFQGVSGEHRITTLGRGGSDTTAVAIAVALECPTCEIYTDVPAVYTADPRLISTASEISFLGFEEMMEMASLGSKILHSRCVEIAAKYNIQIHLRSTFEERKGTWIGMRSKDMEIPVVAAITHEENIEVVELSEVSASGGFLAKLFLLLAEQNVVVDIISQSLSAKGQRIAFSIDSSDHEIMVKTLEQLDISEQSRIIKLSMAKVSAVGVGMRNHPGVAARFFECLQDQGIAIQLVTTSDIKVSVVVDSSDMKAAIQCLHDGFGL